jgi:hypothetical protein
MFKSSPGYRPAIHVPWQMPSNSVLGVHEFIIFQKLPTDSSFALLAQSIPDSVNNYYENIDDIGYPLQLAFKTVLFRMVAIDSIGRTSDTTISDSIVLAWPPNPVSPSESDTLGKDSLIWSVKYVEAGYSSFAMLYRDSVGLIWSQPPPTVLAIGAESDTERFSATIPNSVPLVAGGYSWVIRVEIPSVNAQSMAVRRLYVK